MLLETLNTDEISITFLALFILLFSSFLFGKLFEYIKAPKVVGEIFGGMIIGSSCLALFFPNAINYIFNFFPEEGQVLNIFYQLGLIFLMFSSGYNTSIDINKKNIKNYSFLFIGATIIPLILSLFFTNFFKDAFIGEANNNTAYILVFAISVAVTSIPVISKIFFDIGIMNTIFSNMVLTVSTIQDLCLWIMLNLSINLVQNGKFNITSLISTILLTIGLLIAVKIIEILVNKTNFKINKNILPLSFLLTFIIIFALSKLNINIMYSSFIAGYLMKTITPKEKNDMNKIKDISFSLFIPIYFALVGIQLDVIHNFSLLRFLLFFLIAFTLEFIGTIVPLFLTKLKKKTIINLGITMNARGGPGIVLATTAFAYNIISIEFFTVLIITTMLSSMIAGYWLRFVYNKDKLIFDNI